MHLLLVGFVFCRFAFGLSVLPPLSLWFTLYCRIAAFMIDYWLELYDTRMRECVPHIREHVMTCAILRIPLARETRGIFWVMIDFALDFLKRVSFRFSLRIAFSLCLSLLSLLCTFVTHFRDQTVSFVIEVYVYRSLIELESFSNCLTKCGSCIIMRAIKVLWWGEEEVKILRSLMIVLNSEER